MKRKDVGQIEVKSFFLAFSSIKNNNKKKDKTYDTPKLINRDRIL